MSESSTEQKNEAKIVRRPFGPHCVFQCPKGRGMSQLAARPSEETR